MISKKILAMITIYIFADSHKHFKEAILEYTKRLGKGVQIIELKPVKKGTSEQIITAETDTVLEKLRSFSEKLFVLSPTGKQYSTHELHSEIERAKVSGSKICFVIGGANGLEYERLKALGGTELSLSKVILPHSLALTVLLEQIYRCSEIEKGSAYHK